MAQNSKEVALILGAGGQIGTELRTALQARYGVDGVISTDLKPLPESAGRSAVLNAMDGQALDALVHQEGVTHIYHLVATLSATAEKAPLPSWDLNMQTFFNVMEVAKSRGVRQIFWPSSIAVFGPTTPRNPTPQQTVLEPTTVYGISKVAGELWSQYAYKAWGLDVRSLRYPGLISHTAPPGGGTTDYAVDIFHQAKAHGSYTSFLGADTRLPMMFMEDAIRATLDLMDAPADALQHRTAYNVGAMDFTPAELAAAIQKHLPDFTISYAPDFRQAIADSWPQRIDDSAARRDWGWQPRYGLPEMVETMLANV
jgi:nucleoside-diphosphate-sugar epimerase